LIQISDQIIDVLDACRIAHQALRNAGGGPLLGRALHVARDRGWPHHSLDAAEIRRRHPRVAVVLLSQYVETTHALKLLEQGADGIGYLLKDSVSDVREFVDAVRRVAAGGSAIDPEVVSELLGRKRRRDMIADLTDREREVMALVAAGRSNDEIAEALVITPATAKTHVSRAMAKLGARDRAQLVVLAYETGLVTPAR